MENLDLSCARLGEKLAKAGEKLLTDSLAVLQEQGLYAYFLFLHARNKAEKQKAETMINECVGFLEETPQINPLLAGDQNSNRNVFKKLLNLTSLDDILFARELLMQALVYARYHAKVGGERSS